MASDIRETSLQSLKQCAPAASSHSISADMDPSDRIYIKPHRKIFTLLSEEPNQGFLLTDAALKIWSSHPGLHLRLCEDIDWLQLFNNFLVLRSNFLLDVDTNK